MLLRHSFTLIFALIFFVFELYPSTVQSAVVNCRCGEKPWSNKDLTSVNPSRQCCDYFVESGEGNFTESHALCVIENEFIYKRFHSCCISLIRNAYCFQQKLSPTSPSGVASQPEEEPVKDPWERYEKLFGPGFFGIR